jgi:hypothetical protein
MTSIKQVVQCQLSWNGSHCTHRLMATIPWQELKKQECAPKAVVTIAFDSCCVYGNQRLLCFSMMRCSIS